MHAKNGQVQSSTTVGLPRGARCNAEMHYLYTHSHSRIVCAALIALPAWSLADRV